MQMMKSNQSQLIKYVSKTVVYIVGKEENADFPAFSSFSTMFEKSFTPGFLKTLSSYKRVKISFYLYHTELTFNRPEKKAF